MITEISMNLKKFCIETESRRTYEKLLNRYFNRSNIPKDISEKQIGALEFFLKHADFGYLRSAYPELSGGHPVNVRIQIPEDRYREMKMIWNEKTTAPEWRVPFDE